MTTKRSKPAAQHLSAFEIKARGTNQREVDVFVYGDIGSSWNEDSVTAAKFVRDLQNVDADVINVRINSYGGSVSDALAIFNSLRRHPATVNTFNDGVAVSAASLILMAGERITAAENAMLMIHGPVAMAAGNATTMREMADILDKYAQAMAPTYARGDNDAESMLELLTDGVDHWYTAQEAKDAGFADEITEPVAVAAAHDLRRFKGVPAAAAAFTRSPSMETTSNTTAAQPSAAATQQSGTTAAAPATAQPAAAAPALTVVPPSGGRTVEQNREIQAAYKPFLERTGIRALYDDVMVDTAVTVTAARDKLLTALGSDASPANPTGTRPASEEESIDAVASRIAAAANAARKPKMTARQ